MSIAVTPSVVTMPQQHPGYRLVLDFLAQRFPNIPRQVWLQRMQEGKVHWDDGRLIDAQTVYVPQQRVCYYREVAEEPVIPFAETILYQDEELLVACKPHFLPVTPGGIYVQECLLNRLRRRTGIDTLVPLHRIDRETAGIVLFSVNPAHRGRYHQLFSDGRIRKLYHAVAPVVNVDDRAAETAVRVGQRWLVENRMVKGEPGFRMQTTAGAVNARSTVECVALNGARGLFHLNPLTGKTHQLRVHMCGLGMPLENDRFYPLLHPQSADNYQQPLQLLAKQVEFTDPVTGQQRFFQSERVLQWPAGAPQDAPAER